MSTEKTSDKGKPETIGRSKQSRRKMLKSMAVGGGAVVAGKNLPDQWAKPMVDSVLLPAHAQTTTVVCSISGSASATQATGPFDGADNGLDSTTDSFGPFNLGGSYNESAPASDEITITPEFSVTPGVTDAFNLTTVYNGDLDIAGPDINQNVTPDPANGTLAFNSLVTAGYDDGVELEMTLTPENSSFCGGPQTITITFVD